MLNEDLLDLRLSMWIGYGNLSSEFWILGMEEGGEVTLPMVNVRLGLPPIGDWREAMLQMANAGGIEMKWIRPRPALQPTYYKLIRTFLCAKGLGGGNLKERARLFQRDKFGRRGGDHLIAELMPLHSRTNSNWEYAHLTNRKDLVSRETYERIWLPRRKELFRKLIHEYQPKVVLSYGKEYWKHFRDLGNGKFKTILDGFAETDGKLVLVPHPTARGIKNSQFDEVGYWIREKLL